AGEILKTIGILMQMLPEPVKKVLENRAVQGVMKVTGGVSEIATGCGLCTTAVGCIQGIPLIIFGTNMAFEGIQDLWYTLRGELDKESKNLIKEATGHKVDNLVELAEIGMSIYSGKVASKKIVGKLGEESEKLSGLLKKTRKPMPLVSRTKRLVKKFMPKKRYRKFKVVDIEELAERQCLKPNIQLFANKIIKKAKAYEKYDWYENVADTTQKASRTKNKIHPHPNVTGDHVVYKLDPETGKITNYKVYKVNSKNPTGFDEIVGYDGVGKAHTNKVTEEALMPHVHDKTVPGDLRKPNADEIP
ncbi:MAG: polymorphic toxin type 24 domain-containing protein, partial [Clostridia bacterium]|nr:polymorphic toxin type 24 domain-containing protein [Clostridia bacterium]